LCEGVKYIAKTFNDKSFDKIKGKVSETNSSGKHHEPRVSIKGFKDQTVWESEDEISFIASYANTAQNIDELKKQMKDVALEVEKCLILKPEAVSQTSKKINYTFYYNDNVEIEILINLSYEKAFKIQVIYNKE